MDINVKWKWNMLKWVKWSTKVVPKREIRDNSTSVLGDDYYKEDDIVSIPLRKIKISRYKYNNFQLCKINNCSFDIFAGSSEKDLRRLPSLS